MSFRQKSKSGDTNTIDLQELEEEKQKKKGGIKINRESLVRKGEKHASQYYHIEEEIGQGSFGKVYKVKHKKLNEIRALKIVDKVEKAHYTSFEELEILIKLDHPNVLKIYEYFESENRWYIVTEYFQGQQLFDYIISEKALSQKKAALIFNQILKAITYIHSVGIVHRDLKPENILIKTNGPLNYTIKVIDWGLSVIGKKDLNRKCGTPQYCAPEVIRGKYGYECDLWSLGILLYVMLAGRFPFKGDSVTETLYLVKKANLKFKGEQWQSISQEAKQLILKLLQKQPQKRISAQECLKNEWILNFLNAQNFNEEQFKETLLRIKELAIENKFQAVVINFIHNYLSSPQESQKLKKQFQHLDTNHDGVLSYDELYQGYKSIYGQINASKIVENIFISIDLDCSGSIEYSEFITFATKIQQKFTIEQLKEAFKLFDHDGDGKIDKKQINSLLIYEKGAQSQEFDDLLNEIDLNGDGSIDLDEFIEHINKAIEKLASLSK